MGGSGGRGQEPYTSRSNYQTGQGELPRLANEGDVNFPLEALGAGRGRLQARGGWGRRRSCCCCPKTRTSSFAIKYSAAEGE